MMNRLHTGWDETIVALATAPGTAAIGVIRLSGTRAIAIVNAIFPSKDLEAQPSHTLHVGYLYEGTSALDEVVIALFKNPRSYTGEDIVEISCHGSPYIQQRIISACLTGGARLARAGEFAQRAFLNGKMDLAQAEAVADLIASNTEASQQAALHNMRGGFSGILRNLREQLIQFSALIELELDFSQEDVEFADRSRLYELVRTAATTTRQLIESFRLGNVVKNGVKVAIIGKPNAGKSTLLNALLNEERAIVSDIAGTTRDAIEEVLNINGILFRLIDTAGIREHSTDVIENIGISKSLEKMRQADIVIYLYDYNTETHQSAAPILDELQLLGKAYITVANKTDKRQFVASEKDTEANLDWMLHEASFRMSAHNPDDVQQLKQAIFNKVLNSTSLRTEDTLVTNLRHYEALREVLQSLEDIRQGMDNRLPGDLLALDIRRCLHYLGEITGEISSEDLLDYVFSKFCIGK
jgi:tRNA modification GTPase